MRRRPGRRNRVMRRRESERDLEIKILIFRRFLVKANSEEEASTARAEEDQKDKEAAAGREILRYSYFAVLRLKRILRRRRAPPSRARRRHRLILQQHQNKLRNCASLDHGSYEGLNRFKGLRARAYTDQLMTALLYKFVALNPKTTTYRK